MMNQLVTVNGAELARNTWMNGKQGVVVDENATHVWIEIEIEAACKDVYMVEKQHVSETKEESVVVVQTVVSADNVKTVESEYGKATGSVQVYDDGKWRISLDLNCGTVTAVSVKSFRYTKYFETTKSIKEYKGRMPHIVRENMVAELEKFNNIKMGKAV